MHSIQPQPSWAHILWPATTSFFPGIPFLSSYCPDPPFIPWSALASVEAGILLVPSAHSSGHSVLTLVSWCGVACLQLNIQQCRLPAATWKAGVPAAFRTPKDGS